MSAAFNDSAHRRHRRLRAGSAAEGDGRRRRRGRRGSVGAERQEQFAGAARVRRTGVARAERRAREQHRRFAHRRRGAAAAGTERRAQPSHRAVAARAAARSRHRRSTAAIARRAGPAGRIVAAEGGCSKAASWMPPSWGTPATWRRWRDARRPHITARQDARWCGASPPKILEHLRLGKPTASPRWRRCPTASASSAAGTTRPTDVYELLIRNHQEHLQAARPPRVFVGARQPARRSPARATRPSRSSTSTTAPSCSTFRHHTLGDAPGAAARTAPLRQRLVGPDCAHRPPRLRHRQTNDEI